MRVGVDEAKGRLRDRLTDTEDEARETKERMISYSHVNFAYHSPIVPPLVARRTLSPLYRNPTSIDRSTMPHRQLETLMLEEAHMS
jgi:hypothetical protein